MEFEGTQCAEPSCPIKDFLPFICQDCKKCYCLDHRTKFQHQCLPTITTPVPLQTETFRPAQAKSVKELFHDVESRFDNDTTKYSTKEHVKVKSSRLPTSDVCPDFHAKISRLEMQAQTSTRQKNISTKVKDMLIASKAKGNSSIASEDRFYIVCTFPNSSSPEYLFFNKSATVGEMLQKVGSNFPHQSFGCPVKPDGMTLVFSTEEVPDWKLWNRDGHLTQVIPNFERISLVAKSVDEVLAARSVAEGTEDSKGSFTSNGGLVDPAPYDSRAPILESSTNISVDELQKASVDGDGSIDSPRPPTPSLSTSLAPFPSSSSSSPPLTAITAPTISIPVTHGKLKYDIEIPNLEIKIRELKEVISKATAVPARNQKLICKGKVLRDADAVATTELARGGKVTLMGEADK